MVFVFQATHLSREDRMTMNRQHLALATAALALSLAAAPVAAAAPTCPPGVPEGVGCGEPSLRAATAGTYKVDASHTSVIARVPHLGYSYSVFRFGKVDGTLVWNPSDPAQSKLEATVGTASIETPVEGFAKQLSGEGFLKTAAFPNATFTSTAFRPTSATRGKVDGQLTLMGRTRPITFDVELVGAGAGFGGKPRLGIQAQATIKPQDFGLPATFDRPIKLMLDAEFEKAS
jgi:polyisoprenoid-binding protein YceI